MSDSVIQMLLERIKWPVRLVRWKAAEKFAVLFSSKDLQEKAIGIYLKWLSNQTLESEIVAGLSILLLVPKASLPNYTAVFSSVSKPSILAEMLLRNIFREGGLEWEACHSGSPPDSFSPDKYFLDNKGAQVPGGMFCELKELEEDTELPFIRQWAFEWNQIMKSGEYPHSSIPYHFADSSTYRRGIIGQFSQKQCDVYRSAYVRTFAYAVSEWEMPIQDAVYHASFTLPLNRNLYSIQNPQKPDWLPSISDKDLLDDLTLESLVKSIVQLSVDGKRIVSARIPIKFTSYEHAELIINAAMFSDDYIPDSDSKFFREKSAIWLLQDCITFGGKIKNNGISNFLVKGSKGSYVPVCLNLHPTQMGFWHNDYWELGIALPAPFIANEVVAVCSDKNGITATTSSGHLGFWTIWNDNWTPLYPFKGRPSIGCYTNVNETALHNALNLLGRKLGWHVTLKLWKSESDYSELVYTERNLLFYENAKAA